MLLSACAVHLPAALRRRHGADRRDGELVVAVEEERFRRVGKAREARKRGGEEAGWRKARGREGSGKKTGPSHPMDFCEVIYLPEFRVAGYDGCSMSYRAWERYYPNSSPTEEVTLARTPLHVSLRATFASLSIDSGEQSHRSSRRGQQNGWIAAPSLTLWAAASLVARNTS